jgi:hypothetical protein
LCKKIFRNKNYVEKKLKKFSELEIKFLTIFHTNFNGGGIEVSHLQAALCQSSVAAMLSFRVFSMCTGQSNASDYSCCCCRCLVWIHNNHKSSVITSSPTAFPIVVVVSEHGQF